MAIDVNAERERPRVPAIAQRYGPRPLTEDEHRTVEALAELRRAGWQMLDWRLGMTESRGGAPRDGLSPADAVTLCRFWLVPALPSLARSSSGVPAAIAIGGVTGWLDGALAHRSGRTRLGRDLDTTADLAFLTTAVVSTRAAGKLTRLGFWALAARHDRARRAHDPGLRLQLGRLPRASSRPAHRHGRRAGGPPTPASCRTCFARPATAPPPRHDRRHGRDEGVLAAAYGSEATRWLLGDRLHPGAAALTAALLADAGVEVIVSERRDEAARHRRSRGRSSSPRPRVLPGRPPEVAGVIERALTIVSTARDAIADRELGYGTVVAQRSYGS